MNKLIDYLLRIEGILDENFGIWQVTQYDIAAYMLDDKNNIISFHDFCNLIQNEPCFEQIFNFFIRIADYERRTQELDLIIVLYDFYYFLEELMYPSVFKRFVSDLSTVFLRKHLFSYFRQKQVIREISNNKDDKPDIEGTKGTSEKSDIKKAAEYKVYLYTTYPENEKKKRENICQNKKERLFMSYYDIATRPISSHIIMRGLAPGYRRQKISSDDLK